MADRPNSGWQAVRAAAIESLADECVEWRSGLDRESWIRTLADVNLRENGFEIARDLDRYCRVDGIDAELVEILDGASSHLWSAVRDATKAWVESNGIRPTLAVGDRIDSRHGAGTINGIDEERAVYLLAPDSEKDRFLNGGGILVPYEEAAQLADQVPS